VIADASFIKAEHRALFRNLAAELHVPFLIFDIRADETTMRARIISRASLGGDASDAGLDVLAHQLANHDPLSMDEITSAIVVDMNSGADSERLRKVCEPVLDMLQRPRRKSNMEHDGLSDSRTTGI
jgi:predicted kinase